MGDRRVTFLAWSLTGIAVVITATELVLWSLNADSPVPSDFGSRWVELVDSALFLLFPIMGSLIAWKRPDNPLGWLLAGVSVVITSEEMAREYAFYALITSPGGLPGGAAASWWYEIGWIFGLSALPALFLLFPDGRLISPRWRWCLLAAAIPALIVAGPVAVWVWPYRGADLLVRPESIEAVTRAESLIGPALLILLGAFFASLVSMFLRYRRGGVAERQQLKWLLAAGLVLLIDATIADILVPGEASAIEELIGTIVISLVPVAIAVAILRHRLYDIDRIINRAIVYSVVTGSLVAVYAATVFAIGTVAIGRDDNLTVAVATLVAAALFRPLLRRVQGFVDRRFYRHKYDAQKTIDAFGSRLREETDLNELTEDLVGVVRSTMQPSHVTLWLKAQEGRS
jgi:hypothetical protein